MKTFAARINFACAVCGNEFTRLACHIVRPDHPAKYCSVKCRGVGLRKISSFDEIFLRITGNIYISAEGCWLWLGATKNGYGVMTLNGKRSQYVHRISYELFIGPIHDDRELDHLCMVRPCINPDHLEAVTHQDNILRGYRMRRGLL